MSTMAKGGGATLLGTDPNFLTLFKAKLDELNAEYNDELGNGF